MNRYQEIISISLIIFLLIIILFIMGLLNKNYNNEELNDIFNEENLILSESEIIEIAKKDLEILRLFSRNKEIIDGPRIVTQNDRNKIPSIYPDYEPLYLIVIKQLNYDLYVVINQSSVINKVPLSYFA